MDMSLTAEQDAVRKAVHEWVDDVVVPRALSNDREERFPQEALDGLKQTGFIGMTIPEEFGGGGADPLSYLLLIEELGRGDANVRSIVSVHLGLVAGVIERMGTQAQKERWLPQMATGEVLACFGLTEPDYGSDAGNLQATAVKTDERRLPHQRPQDLHHQRHDRRPGARHGPHRRPGRQGRQRVPRPDRDARLHRQPDPRQARPALVRHRGARPRRRRGRRGRAARRPGGHRHEGGAVGARRRPHVDRGVLHRHHAGLPRLDDRATRRSASSSARRSPPTSSCRSSSPTPPSSSTPPG